jgi:predicted ribosome quality control (RQC) complex YloA/Tae2 family protein
MKKNLSGLELKFVIAELQELVNSKVAKIYQPAKKEIYLQLYGQRIGKKLLRIAVPRFIYRAELRQTSPENPFGFCQSLRKHLEQSILTEIVQRGLERLVELRFQARDASYTLVVELFGKGNVILCSGDNILAVMEPQRYKDRELKTRVNYVAPKASVDITSMSLKQLQEMLNGTDKTNLATFVAVELGLGGVYAEEVCLRAGLDKNKVKLSEKETEILHRTLKNLLETTAEPQVIDSGVDIIPFELKYYERANKQQFKTYNEALDFVLSKATIIDEKDEASDAERQRLDKILKMQQESVAEMEKEIDDNQRKAEYIYEHYQEVRDILEKVNSELKKLSKEELVQKFGLKDLNLKDKTITVNL